MKLSVFAAVTASAMVLTASSAIAATATVVGTDVGDQYLSPHSGNPGSVNAVPIFANETPGFPFNYHYSAMPIKWTLDLPAEFDGAVYEVTSATITLWNTKDDGGWDPATGDIQLFNAGVTGENGFTRETWAEDDIHYNKAGDVQDPYLVELGTGNHAEDNPSAIPWAVADVDPSYTGQATPGEAFKVTFTLDVNNPEIQAQLKDDLTNGFSMFAVASTITAEQSGGTYPRLVTKEGVGDASLGTLQQAPALTIEIAEQASARDWNLY